jgi:ribonuclease HIII
MDSVEDYVARTEETCGEEKAFIIIFKYDKKEQAITKILKKAKIEKSISNIIFELNFKGVSFRLYSTGKAIFRNLKNKNELNSVLNELLS